MSPIIIADHVSKSFHQRVSHPGFINGIKGFFSNETKQVHAVNDVSFAIEAGEAVGYLGANGAGKSTMIKMLTGILVPSEGSVAVLGRVPHEKRIENARDIGVVFGQRSQLWWDLPVRDSFELNRRIYRIPTERYQHNRQDLITTLDMRSYIDRPVRQLSLGQRMRAEIAMALLHGPKVLFLDEPTIGLDVVVKDVVRKFLANLNKTQGTNIILTTHDLKDIEEICPRLMMVDDGKLLFDGPLEQLNTTFGARQKLTLEFFTDPGVLCLDGADPVIKDGPVREFLLQDNSRSLVQIIAALGDRVDLKDISLHEPDIEEVIRTYYQSKPIHNQPNPIHNQPKMV